MVAYYCFVNLGWPPSKYNNLPPEEKALVMVFALRSMDEAKKLKDEMKVK